MFLLFFRLNGTIISQNVNIYAQPLPPNQYLYRLKGNIISKPTEVEDDHVLREFHNSLYESADHTRASATAPEYYMPHQMNVEQQPEEICNPTYGLGSMPHRGMLPTHQHCASRRVLSMMSLIEKILQLKLCTVW